LAGSPAADLSRKPANAQIEPEKRHKTGQTEAFTAATECLRDVLEPSVVSFSGIFPPANVARVECPTSTLIQRVCSAPLFARSRDLYIDKESPRVDESEEVSAEGGPEATTSVLSRLRFGLPGQKREYRMIESPSQRTSWIVRSQIAERSSSASYLYAEPRRKTRLTPPEEVVSRRGSARARARPSSVTEHESDSDVKMTTRSVQPPFCLEDMGRCARATMLQAAEVGSRQTAAPYRYRSRRAAAWANVPRRRARLRERF